MPHIANLKSETKDELNSTGFVSSAQGNKSPGAAPASASLKAHGPLVPKLKSRRMLEHIAYLMTESVKTSEEKLALAASAYDSVSLSTRIGARVDLRFVSLGG